MDQNNAKIVLILLFSLGLLVQARPSLLDAIKNVRELGVGTCSIEKYSELTQTMQECSQQKQAELQSGGQGSSFTLCSIIGPMLQCNFTEFLQYAIIIIIIIIHSMGQKFFKKVQTKKLVKSNKSISRFFCQNPFFAISKMTQVNF